GGRAAEARDGRHDPEAVAGRDRGQRRRRGAGGCIRRGERDGAVTVAGGQRAGGGRRGDERVDGADDGLDLAEHREREGDRRHGHQGRGRGERGRRGGAFDGGGD